MCDRHKVLSALASVTNSSGDRIPVPRVANLCMDPAVVGTPFYLMQHLDGRIFKDVKLPYLSPNERAAVYDEVARVMAAIHSADVVAAGLGNFGKVEDYCARQVSRWKRQYDASAVGDARTPAMAELAAWLLAHVPPEPQRPSVIHGDYRLDNLVFAPHESKVIGVLDWELSTLGDPLADAAYSCLVYHMPPGLPVLDALDTRHLPAGVPTEAQFVHNYCRRAGVPVPTDTWPFYVALGMFRAAAIAAGVHRRAMQGNASAANAAELGACYEQRKQRHGRRDELYVGYTGERLRPRFRWQVVRVA